MAIANLSHAEIVVEQKICWVQRVVVCKSVEDLSDEYTIPDAE